MKWVGLLYNAIPGRELRRVVHDRVPWSVDSFLWNLPRCLFLQYITKSSCSSEWGVVAL